MTCDPNSGQCAPRPDEFNPGLLIAGAGSAAFSAAITAAGLGARVVMAGSGTIGGTCVNVGCVPSKTLIRAVETIHQARSASRFHGIQGDAELHQWPALMEQKRALVSQLRKSKYEDLLPRYPGITYIQGHVEFLGEGLSMRAGEAVYTPRKVILATGSSPAPPLLPGITEIPLLDSSAALDLDELPESLLVIGGGVIGCELGQMFARAGAKVTICCRRRLLPDAEPEISEALAGLLRREGIRICQRVGYQRIDRNGRGVVLSCDSAQGQLRLEASHVLAATGRQPNVASLHPERAGIELNSSGGIRVNEYRQTTHPDVYAAGDVTGEDLFVYMAAYSGKLAARNALQGNSRRYDNTAMPAVVFTDPQAARVGLTERQAREAGHSVRTTVIPLSEVPRNIAGRDSRGLIKLVASGETGRLLGASILGPEAGEVVQTAALALKAGLTVNELGDTIFPYLTAVEGLKLAAQSFDTSLDRLSCCAG